MAQPTAGMGLWLSTALIRDRRADDPEKPAPEGTGRGGERFCACCVASAAALVYTWVQLSNCVPCTKCFRSVRSLFIDGGPCECITAGLAGARETIVAIWRRLPPLPCRRKEEEDETGLWVEHV